MEFQANNKSNLNTAENVINFASNMFTSGYSNSEPIISSITEVLGDDAENILNIDLEEFKLEKFLSSSDYKVWKSLRTSEKERLLWKIEKSAEYKEMVKALKAIKDDESVDISEKLIKVEEKYKNKFERTKEYKAFEKWDAKQAKKAAKHPDDEKFEYSKDDYIPTDKFKKIENFNNLVKKTADKLATELIFNPGATQMAKNDAIKQQGAATGKTLKKTVKNSVKLANLVKKIAEKGMKYITQGIMSMLSALAPFIFVFYIIVIIIILICGVFHVYQSTFSKNIGVMPYYAQADYKQPFNGGTIASDGCGITSMAMVASLYKGEAITPDMLATMANQDSGYNTVNSHQAINKFAQYFELGFVEEMGGPSKNCCGNKKFDMQYVKDKIVKGAPVIVSVSGGYYNPSGGGHYIALYGKGTNGVFVYDPGSRKKYKESVNNDGSDWDMVFANAKHIWIFKEYIPPELSAGGNTYLVYQRLKQAGFSDAAACAVIGNMYQESSKGLSDLKPSAESKDGSIGLIQWTGGRKHQLINLAGNRRSEWQDINVQIEFLLQELNVGGQWKWTNYSARKYPSSDHISLEEFKKLDNPEYATEVFQANFVRPNFEKSNLDYRKSMARKYFDLYTGR